MVQYSLSDIKRAVPLPYFERGLDYQQRNKVSDVNIEAGGRKITGRVQGSDTQPYRVVAYVQPRGRNDALIHGNCTCPLGGNCKHVVAVLAQALQAQVVSVRAMPTSGTNAIVQDWLSQVERALDPPPPVTEALERLLYLLSVNRDWREPRLLVEFVSVRRLKDGTYGKEQRFNGDPNSTARCLTLADKRLLRGLSALKNSPSDRAALIADAGAESARLLSDLLATGRCHWQDYQLPPLLLGAARSAHFEWTLGDDGMQRLTCIGDGIDVVLPVAPPWYVDLNARQSGPLDTGVSEQLAQLLMSAPELNAEQAAVTHTKLSSKKNTAALPIPRHLENVVNETFAPAPCLHLFMARIPLRRDYRWQVGADNLNVELARLSFNYGGLLVEAGDPRSILTRAAADRITCITRDAALEQVAWQRLGELNFISVALLPLLHVPAAHEHHLTLFDETSSESMMDFCAHGVPELRAQGWTISMAEDFPYRMVEGEVKWYADIEEESGNDWFGVELGVTIGDKRVSLLPLLLQLVRQFPDEFTAESLDAAPAGKAVYARLDDGRLLPLPLERVRPILNTLVELFDSDARHEERLRLPAIRAAQLAELEATLDTRVAWNGGERLRGLGKRLREFAGIAAVATPAGLQTQLREYQQQGLNWLQFLREYEMGGILADDMGLGKTVQTLAHLLVEKDSGRMDRPSLVIAPTSLMVNWRMEAERFAPALRVLVSHGLERKQQFTKLADYDLVLTTYPLLPRDFEMLNQQEYHLLILDEAQVVKNPKAKASQLVRQLRARRRLCLTGTPMENHLGELWSLFDFLMPGLLGDERQFRRLFRNPIEKHADKERSQSLSRRIAPFLLRRTKQEVAKDLPPKTEILRNVELAGSQRDLYESIRLAMHEKVRSEISKKGLARSHIIILDALLKLRQVCCDPRLLKLDSAKKVTQSAKLESLLEMLPELIEEGRRVLLFSQFTSMLALIQIELKKLKLDYVILTGDTTDRATPVQRFQNCEVPLFLISLKAGGTGLNLTAADTVIHYDPWWNPAVENQATDRAHRIGQDKPVFVYKMLTIGTVEEKILAMQARKKELADSLFDPEAKGGSRLTQDDLNALFEPLM